MQDANEMECLIFKHAIRNIVLGKVTKSGGSEANNKLIINIFLIVGSYRPQPLRNRVKPYRVSYAILFCLTKGTHKHKTTNLFF